MPPPLFLFAPGAGAPSSSSWMRHWAELLRTIGAVRTFDYPYMTEQRARPDPLPKLIAFHREVLLQLQQSQKGPVVLIGKSMGSRVACHVALKEDVGAIVCLGYPLCGGGDPQKPRDRVLRELSTPILFIQGTRDRLCPLALLDKVREGMRAANEVFAVSGGDHSLSVTKGQLKADGETQNDVDQRILRRIQAFVQEYGQVRET
jgi:uncharacterized protein